MSSRGQGARSLPRAKKGFPDPSAEWSAAFDASGVTFERYQQTLIVRSVQDLYGIDLIDGSTVWHVESVAPAGRWFVVDGDQIIVGKNSLVTTLDPATGEQRWQVDIEETVFDLHLSGEHVFVSGRLGGWYVVDRADGSVVQSGRLEHTRAEVVGTIDGTLFVYPLGEWLQGFDLETGEHTWTLEEPISTGVTDGEQLYVMSTGAVVSAFDPPSTTESWKYSSPAPREYGGELLVDDGDLFARGPSTVDRVNTTNGDRDWRFTRDTTYGPAIATSHDETVYVVAGTDVYALDRPTGETAWVHETQGDFPSVLAQDRGVIVNEGDRLAALAHDGTVHWRLGLASSSEPYLHQSIAAADGIVAAVNGDTITGLAVNEPPSVDIGVQTSTPTARTPVRFEAVEVSDPESSPDALTFDWSFGDGGTASGRTVEHTYTDPGSYTVAVTASDPVGGSTTAETTVSIGATPTPESTPTASPTAAQSPGFGSVATLFGIGGVVGWLARRRSDESGSPGDR